MSGPVTLVTGTRKGIGQKIATHLCAAGHTVYGCSRTEPEWRAENYKHIIADVSSEEDAKRVFREIRKSEGRLDNLINNAGIASMNHSLLTPASTLHTILNTNVIGCFVFCREAAKLMQLKKAGRIVNFSSVAVPLKLKGEAAYVASKAAVQALTDVLSKEFARYGITVNTVGPGPIMTDLIKAVPEEKIQEIVNSQSIRRLGTFDDVINVVEFFISPQSDFITGQHIFLGGL